MTAETPRVARNCAHWAAALAGDFGVCARCGVPWQLFAVHGAFACPGFRERRG